MVPIVWVNMHLVWCFYNFFAYDLLVEGGLRGREVVPIPEVDGSILDLPPDSYVKVSMGKTLKPTLLLVFNVALNAL